MTSRWKSRSGAAFPATVHPGCTCVARARSAEAEAWPRPMRWKRNGGPHWAARRLKISLFGHFRALKRGRPAVANFCRGNLDAWARPGLETTMERPYRGAHRMPFIGPWPDLRAHREPAPASGAVRPGRSANPGGLAIAPWDRRWSSSRYHSGPGGWNRRAAARKRARKSRDKPALFRVNHLRRSLQF